MENQTRFQAFCASVKNIFVDMFSIEEITLKTLYYEVFGEARTEDYTFSKVEVEEVEEVKKKVTYGKILWGYLETGLYVFAALLLLVLALIADAIKVVIYTLLVPFLLWAHLAEQRQKKLEAIKEEEAREAKRKEKEEQKNHVASLIERGASYHLNLLLLEGKLSDAQVASWIAACQERVEVMEKIKKSLCQLGQQTLTELVKADCDEYFVINQLKAYHSGAVWTDLVLAAIEKNKPNIWGFALKEKPISVQTFNTFTKMWMVDGEMKHFYAISLNPSFKLESMKDSGYETREAYFLFNRVASSELCFFSFALVLNTQAHLQTNCIFTNRLSLTMTIGREVIIELVSLCFIRGIDLSESIYLKSKGLYAHCNKACRCLGRQVILLILQFFSTCALCRLNARHLFI